MSYATDLLLAVDPAAATPLHRQIYDGLRRAIVEGRAAAGERLPSSRELATALGVGRNTVTAAFEQLRAEGYVTGHSGGGTRVRPVLPDRLLTPRERVRRPRAFATSGALSRRGEALVEAASLFPAGAEPAQAFRIGLPALDVFPRDVWARLVSRRWKRPPPLEMSDPAGYAPLRRAVAGYVSAARGVRCGWEQVVIVSGAQHGLHLAAQLLLDPADAVWMEDPGYPGARAALTAAGARLVPVPVDAEGMRVDEARRREPTARMAYLTPSHQFPLGGLLGPRRRLELLGWARETNSWLLEDDYDSEFRYVGRPLPSLQGQDEHGRVIYIGTFCKTLYPGLRLGYLVVPDGLVDAFAAARSLADRHPPVMEQAVVADFLEEGHFVRHLRRMRIEYAARQDALVSAARSELDGLLELPPEGAGMHLVGWLPAGADERDATARAARAGVVVMPLGRAAIEPPPRPALLLGYAGVRIPEIRLGARRLAEALSGD